MKFEKEKNFNRIHINLSKPEAVEIVQLFAACLAGCENFHPSFRVDENEVYFCVDSTLPAYAVTHQKKTKAFPRPKDIFTFSRQAAEDLTTRLLHYVICNNLGEYAYQVAFHETETGERGQLRIFNDDK